MRILYVFPHPDDESFGPGPSMYTQQRAGHEVYLLTLTRGEATKQRKALGYSKEEMGRIRARETREAAGELGVSDVRILDFPDSGLKELDPRELEKAVSREIRERQPHVVVTYPVHGISGFHDHLVSHAVVKRVFCVLREEMPSLRRLAFYTIAEGHPEPGQGGEERGDEDSSGSITLESTPEAEIDCRVSIDGEAERRGQRALDQYETYQAVIEATDVRSGLGRDGCFEIYQEHHDPPLQALTDELEVAPQASGS